MLRNWSAAEVPYPSDGWPPLQPLRIVSQPKPPNGPVEGSASEQIRTVEAAPLPPYQRTIALTLHTSVQKGISL